MKKIFIVLLTFFLIGCMDKTDERGFYTSGKKIGYNKETGTLYDKDGYNVNGWNKEGINKETGYNFDKEGKVEKIKKNNYYDYIPKDIKEFKNIRTASLGDSLEYKENPSAQIKDEFYGNVFMSLSFFEPIVNSNIALYLIEITNALSKFSKSKPDKEIGKEKEELFKKVSVVLNTAYLDLYTGIKVKDEIVSHLVLTFSSLNKISDIKKVEFLIKNNGPYTSHLENLVDVSKAVLNTLQKNEYIEFREEQIVRNPFINKNIVKDKAKKLNEEQARWFEGIKYSIENSEYSENLIYGITGSRKNRSLFAID